MNKLHLAIDKRHTGYLTASLAVAPRPSALAMVVDRAAKVL